MNQGLLTVLTIIGSVIASSGFWAWMQKRADKKDATKEMLLGLAHDRILYLGTSYIERGDWITQDEYENLNDYLYKPYEKLGGNGTAKKVMNTVNAKLTICKQPPYKVGQKTVCGAKEGE
jgi:hypothetical protein